MDVITVERVSAVDNMMSFSLTELQHYAIVHHCVNLLYVCVHEYVCMQVYMWVSTKDYIKKKTLINSIIKL